jgi:hypothetical protein
MKNLWKIGTIILNVCGVLFMVGLFVILNPALFKPLIAGHRPLNTFPAPARAIYFQIPKSQFRPEFIDRIQEIQLMTGDSLDQIDGLKKEGLLKSGMIWFGISHYTDSVFAFFDYYRSCECGPDKVNLVRFVPVDSNLQLRRIADLIMPWNKYFLYADDTLKVDSARVGFEEKQVYLSDR